MAVYTGNHVKQTNILFGENGDFLNVEADAAHSNCCST
jgi:hypothetical protein